MDSPISSTPSHPRLGAPEPSGSTPGPSDTEPQPNRGGAPEANWNALKSGKRSRRLALQNTLLPPSMRHIDKKAGEFRRGLEAKVVEAKGAAGLDVPTIVRIYAAMFWKKCIAVEGFGIIQAEKNSDPDKQPTTIEKARAVRSQAESAERLARWVLDIGWPDAPASDGPGLLDVWDLIAGGDMPTYDVVAERIAADRDITVAEAAEMLKAGEAARAEQAEAPPTPPPDPPEPEAPKRRDPGPCWRVSIGSPRDPW